MSNETKKVATKKATANQEVKKEVKQVKETKEVKNEQKVNTAISMDEVVKLYQELNIACKNPNAKGNYRIMRGGSSLNVTRKAYNIYSTDTDLELVKAAKIAGVEVEAGANAQDKTRPHTVRCTTIDSLKAILAVYAKNPENVAPLVVTDAAVETALAK